MKVNKSDVEHVAKLARLGLSEEEKNLFTQQLNQILEFADKINKLNTDNIEPTAHIMQVPTPYRDDVVKPFPNTADILKNAPQEEKNMFRVPRILE